MRYGEAILILVLSSVAAGWVTSLVHRRIELEWRRHHHEVGSVIFLQLGVVFAVLLAFVCNECLGGYNDAQAAIDRECGALHGAAILAATLPPPAAHAILNAEIAYIEVLVQREWPAMENTRHGDHATRDAIVRMLQAAAEAKLSDPDDRARQSQIVSLFAEAHSQSEERLYEAANGIPAALWGVLIGLTAVLSSFVAFAGIEDRPTAVTVAVIFTAGTVSVLLVARLLNYPFEGALALTPANFIETLGNITALK